MNKKQKAVRKRAVISIYYEKENGTSTVSFGSDWDKLHLESRMDIADALMLIAQEVEANYNRATGSKKLVEIASENWGNVEDEEEI